MPAKPLTKEQLEDAKRLKDAFTAFKARKVKNGEPMNQDLAADALGFNQSAVNQYLNGKIPLNADALVKFCRLMDEKPEDISPSIYRSELVRSMALANPKAEPEVDVTKQFGPSAPIPEDVMKALAAAPIDTRNLVEATVRQMLGMGPSRKQMARMRPPAPVYELKRLDGIDRNDRRLPDTTAKPDTSRTAEIHRIF